MTTHCELCQLGAALDQGTAPAGTLIWRDAQVSVVAVDEAEYPGFCRVVWNAHVKEVSDLLPRERHWIMDVVWQVELAQREIMQPEKINLASLGNMTPHVHWHVIPRYLDDAHFPHPVWAAAQRSSLPEVLAARRALLPQLHADIVARLGG